MKVRQMNMKKGEVDIQVTNKDDLWHLSHLIDTGDRISGHTQRKIKKTEEGGAVKKTIWLEIEVTNVEFESLLRVSGTVTQGPEDVPLGSFHTFSVDESSAIKIIKPKWYGYQLERLRDAQRDPETLLMVLLDREEALFAQTTPAGYKVLAKLRGSVAKKGVDTPATGSFYKNVITTMKEYDSRLKPAAIILASPSFWKEELLKVLTDSELKQKIVQATCSSVTKSAIDEVLKRPEIKEALKRGRAANELNYVESLLVAISKGGAAAYGLQNVIEADALGAISHLLITDATIQHHKQAGTFDELDALMKNVDSKKGEVHIISSEHGGGKKLDGIGGIGAILRFPIHS